MCPVCPGSTVLDQSSTVTHSQEGLHRRNLQRRGSNVGEGKVVPYNGAGEDFSEIIPGRIKAHLRFLCKHGIGEQAGQSDCSFLSHQFLTNGIWMLGSLVLDVCTVTAMGLVLL